ncbi:MAG TPA: sialidase family protein [Gemmatimonadaceae bacterium]|nr:sialidase family protein [Gemmatimonadaceae bacterium]
MSATLLVAACARGPIEWQPQRDIGSTIGPTTRLAIDADGSPRLIEEPTLDVALPAAACAGSLVTTRAGGAERYAAWYVPRSDSSVVLQVARSTDGGATWSTPVVADERDQGRRGCSRPRPSLLVDSTTSYVHAAYFIEPSEGAGVWYTHSMERGTLWHERIGVLYGEEPVATSIASAGDTVMVAYEHPGSAGRRLGLAISRQAGHTFDERLRVVRVSGSARNVRVALRAGRVALAWSETLAGDSSSRRPTTRVMLGSLR